MSALASSLSRNLRPKPKSVCLGSKKQRRARELICWLRPLELQFPEFRAIIQEAIEDLHHEAARNPEADAQMVLRAIHSGLWSITDLLDELPIKRKALQAILDHFLQNQTVIRKVPEVRSDLGGRPEALYLPAPNTLCK